jgi:acetyl esterase/lipase
LERHHYGRARSHFAELYLPDGDGPFPVAVVLHGGFWKAQYGRKMMRPVCEDLRARGWAAWNLEYRRLGVLSGGGWPNTLVDIARGIDHLADLPPECGLDLDRVVAIGHSAGGHLATWAASRTEMRVRVAAVVSQAGVVDLREAWERRLSDGVVRRFLGGTPEDRPERYDAASPAEHLPLGVPVLLTHGALDDIVPPEMSRRFAVTARAEGDECTLVELEGEDHFGHIDPANPLWKSVVGWLDRL